MERGTGSIGLCLYGHRPFPGQVEPRQAHFFSRLRFLSFWNEDRPIVALTFFLLATRNGLPNGKRAFHSHPHAGSGPPLHLCWDRSHGEAAPVHTVAHLHVLPLLRSLCEPPVFLPALHPAQGRGLKP